MRCFARVLAGGLLVVSISYAQPPQWRVEQVFQNRPGAQLWATSSSGYAVYSSGAGEVRLNPDGSETQLPYSSVMHLHEDGMILFVPSQSAVLWHESRGAMTYNLPSGDVVGFSSHPTGGVFFTSIQVFGMHVEQSFWRGIADSQPQYMGGTYTGEEPGVIGSDGSRGGNRVQAGRRVPAFWSGWSSGSVTRTTSDLEEGVITIIKDNGNHFSMVRKSGANPGHYAVWWDSSGQVISEEFVAPATSPSELL